jgi:hypothetical protein
MKLKNLVKSLSWSKPTEPYKTDAAIPRRESRHHVKICCDLNYVNFCEIGVTPIIEFDKYGQDIVDHIIDTRFEKNISGLRKLHHLSKSNNTHVVVFAVKENNALVLRASLFVNYTPTPADFRKILDAIKSEVDCEDMSKWMTIPPPEVKPKEMMTSAERLVTAGWETHETEEEDSIPVRELERIYSTGVKPHWYYPRYRARRFCYRFKNGEAEVVDLTQNFGSDFFIHHLEKCLQLKEDSL